MCRKAMVINMPVFIRRLIETVIITLISSLPIYILLKIQIIYPSKFGSFLAFLISALIFLKLNAVVLKSHLMNMLNCKVYLKTNIILYIIQVGVCYILMYFTDANTYTALFGFTRVFFVFIPLLGKSPILRNVISAALFWVIYFFQIIYYFKKLSGVIEKITDDIDEYGLSGYNMNTIEYLQNKINQNRRY